MTKHSFLTVLALCAIVFSLTGCATGRAGRWAGAIGRTVGPTAALVLTVDNGSNLYVGVYENGQPVSTPDGREMYIPPKGVVSRGYPAFFSRSLTVTLKGICPPGDQKVTGCVAGSTLRSESRVFYVSGDGQQRAEVWQINW